MSEITRVPEKLSGVKDGVEMDCKCVYSIFRKEKMSQQLLNCKAMASWENGVLSLNFTVGGRRQSVGVRLDELVALLCEASAARKESVESEDKS